MADGGTLILGSYLNRVVLTRVAASVIAVTLFALFFDLLDASDDIIRTDGNTAAAFALYLVLRLPSLMSEVLPFAALIGALFAAAELMRNGELTIYWSAGISPLGILLRLLPVCLLVFALKLVIDDQLVPATAQELRAWGVGFFKGDVDGFAGDQMWVQHEDSIIRLPRLEPSQNEASDLLILKQDAEGNLVERIKADRAVLDQGQWHLLDVERGRVGEGLFEQLTELTFANSVDLDNVRVMARPPQEVALLELFQIVRQDGFGVSSVEAHKTAIYYRLFGATLPALMIMLTFALARRVTRQGGVAGLFLKGITTGFIFVIASGLALALAEAGFVGPILASAGPVLALFVLVIGLPLRDERLWRRRAFA